MSNLIVVLGILVVTSLLLAQDVNPWLVPEAAKKHKNPVTSSPESIKKGMLFYRGNCMPCHGEKGDGDGPKREELPRKPGDFTDRRKMSTMADGEIFWKMSKGRDPMPSFAAKLSEEQHWHLVNYVRTFANK